MTQKVLILGASGRFGRHAAKAFEGAGWQVDRFQRGNDLQSAAQGADMIVNAWNPPYHQWAREVPGQTQQVIAAAKATGAAVMIPGNIYVYGPDMPAVIGPETPHRATNPLGMIRREMEEAYRRSGLQVIILRAGDYIDDAPSGNWFDKIIARDAAKGRMTYPGRRDIDHAWAYLPDLAHAAVGLAEARAGLPQFSDMAYGGLTLSGEEMAAAISAALGREMRIKSLRWPVIQLLRPVWRDASGICEMRYLWNTPHRMDGSKLAKLLPDLPKTPPVTVMQRAISGLGGQLNINPQQAMA